MAIWIMLGCFAVVAVWLVAVYNSLVRKRNLMRDAESGVDVQLTRRHELVPNLVSVVKGYAAHEADVLEGVTEARAASMRAAGMAGRAEAEGLLGAALGKLLAVAENYPDLKASANFLDLQDDLAKLEDEIQLARRYYNGAVRELNNAVESFPANLVAARFGFGTAEFFDLEDPAARTAPKVAFT